MSTNSGNLLDASSTIATGGATQQALAATQRQYLLIENPTTETEALYVNFGAIANLTNSISIAPGGSLTFETGVVPGQTVNVLAATTGHRYIIKWC